MSETISQETHKPFDPLDGNTPDKDYTKQDFAGEVRETIPAPVFERPSVSFDFELDGESQQPEPSRPEAAPSDSGEPSQFNPAYNDLSRKEKENGAEMAADTVINLYEAFNKQMLARVPKLNKAKLQKKVATGALDIDHTFPIDDEGTTANVLQYAEVFNDSIDSIFDVSQEFKDEIRPPLERILQKRGVAMTDEQRVAFLVGQDLFVKGIMAFNLRRETNMILKHLEAEAKSKQTPISHIVSSDAPTFETEGQASQQSMGTPPQPEPPVNKTAQTESAFDMVAPKEKFTGKFAADGISLDSNLNASDDQLARMDEIAKSGGVASQSRQRASRKSVATPKQPRKKTASKPSTESKA